MVKYEETVYRFYCNKTNKNISTYLNEIKDRGETISSVIISALRLYIKVEQEKVQLVESKPEPAPEFVVVVEEQNFVCPPVDTRPKWERMGLSSQEELDAYMRGDFREITDEPEEEKEIEV